MLISTLVDLVILVCTCTMDDLVFCLKIIFSHFGGGGYFVSTPRLFAVFAWQQSSSVN